MPTATASPMSISTVATDSIVAGSLAPRDGGRTHEGTATVNENDYSRLPS